MIELRCKDLHAFYKLSTQELRNADAIWVGPLLVKGEGASRVGLKVLESYFDKTVELWAFCVLETDEYDYEAEAEDACQRAVKLLGCHYSRHPHPDVYVFTNDKGEPKVVIHRSLVTSVLRG